jgi:hypothetical protein
MPTKRRKLTARPIGISPRAIEAWQAGDVHGCHQALGIWPWDHSPFHVTSAEPPQWLVDRDIGSSDAIAGVENWRRAWSLRTALIQLAGPPGEFDRHGRPLGPAEP